jgi:hypothetical protein
VSVSKGRAAIEASPVRDRIRRLNLNRSVSLDRMFDVVWSYEAAEHIHSKYTETFIQTLTSHGPVVVTQPRNLDRVASAILTNSLRDTGLSDSNAVIFLISLTSLRISSFCQTPMRAMIMVFVGRRGENRSCTHRQGGHPFYFDRPVAPDNCSSELPACGIVLNGAIAALPAPCRLERCDASDRRQA